MESRRTSNAPQTYAWNQGYLKIIRTIVHVFAAVQFCFAIYYNFMYVVFPPSTTRSTWGGKFRFLTFLDAIIQAIYYIISSANDFIGSNEVAPRNVPTIRKVKDYMFASLAFPLALNVGLTFWTLWAINRELVFPAELDAVFPSWLNHILHTNIVIFIVLEMFISFREYPQRFKGLAGLMTFMGCYIIWIHIIRHNSGFWVYPVLEKFNFPLRMLFFAGCFAFVTLLYFCGETLNKVFWAKELKLAQRKVNKEEEESGELTRNGGSDVNDRFLA